MFLEEFNVMSDRKLPTKMHWTLCLCAALKMGKRMNISWWTAPEHVLDDALLMLAIHVQKDARLVALAREVFKDRPLESGLNLHSDREAFNLHSLYACCREMKWAFKIVLTALRGSAVIGALDQLKKYSIPSEICISRPNHLE
jgi:hypothetical protein